MQNHFIDENGLNGDTIKNGNEINELPKFMTWDPVLQSLNIAPSRWNKKLFNGFF